MQCLIVRTIFYTFWCMLYCYTVIKYTCTYSNIIVFLRKFYEMLGPQSLSHCDLIEKQLIKSGNNPLGVPFNLRFSKLKSDY